MKGIYKITFENNKSYIGQSCDLDRRFSEYRNWKSTCKNQTALYNAFNKYKKYEIVIIESSLDFTQEDLDSKEVYYIEKYNTLTPNGYNIQKGGKGYSGYKIINEKDLFNNSEPIINIETGEVYLNCEDWMLKNKEIKLEDQYNLYEKDYKFQFKNPNNVEFYGLTYPKNATLADIFNEKAIQYVELPITLIYHCSYTNKLIEQREEIEALKKEIAELKALTLKNKS